MQSSAFPIPEPTPEFLRLESSIRALSTAIHEIQGQCEFRPPDADEACPDDSAVVFSQLATLLTTGSPVGRQRVVVTGGSSHRGFFVNAAETVVGDDQAIFAEPAAVQLKIVTPTQKTLKQLADDKRPLSHITLTEHAGDVLQALRLVNQDIYAPEREQRRTLECFIARRCHSEINRRVQSAVGLLNPPLHDVLGTWELHSSDRIREEWLVIPYPLILLESLSIPHRPTSRCPARSEFLFNRHTFGLWKRLFVSLLKVVFTTVTGFNPGQTESAADVVLALHFLRLFLSFGPARQILEMPSLGPVLWANLLPQNQLEYDDRQENSPIQIILRAWTAVVAYDAAISFLTFQQGTVSSILRCSLPTVHIINVPARTTTARSMDSIPGIMRSKVIPALNLSRHYAGVVEALISQHLSITEFPGEVHSEATMMGIAYAFSHGKYAKDDFAPEKSTLGAFHDAFEGHSNTIGNTEERSCQICYWLSEELLLSNGYFTLHAKHAKTVPWSPPRFGIPLLVLRNLELELVELLVDSTYRWLEQRTRWPREFQKLPKLIQPII
ncbi:hypothetical protein DFH07DRAFT_1024613 [Mycena maculata]|uniref:Uncharacterized protein n=1 Tax=Mycena maculata TaxID=230809 RepID=A0AAD7NFH2_9AGAR|nr:hypothetical protein DFH07DRAFT_1024613 [Mycena maculata]